MDTMGEGVTLVLGGVGIRGVANIGCLHALRNHGVRIDRIVATGISAVIAAQFALDGDIDQLADRFARFFSKNHRYLWGLEHVGGGPRVGMRRELGNLSCFLRQRLFCERNLQWLSMLPDEIVTSGLSEIFGERTTADLTIPITVCAIDLNRREEVPLTEGKLVELVHAGVAFPGLFPPVSIGGTEFVSSALYSELPLGCVRQTDSPIMAIDLPQPLALQRPRSLMEILTRSDEGRSRAMKEILLARADTVIRLDSIRRISWGSYRRIPQLVQRAQTEMSDRLSHLDLASGCLH
jgi:NTE family protein